MVRPPRTVAVFDPSGFSNHAARPPYQIAVQSASRPATTKDCPVTAVSPQSLIFVVPAEPSGCRAGSDSSGASDDGAVRSSTKFEGWAGSCSQPEGSQLVNGGMLPAKPGVITTVPPGLGWWRAAEASASGAPRSSM